ncbi:MAG: hypothetical protein JXR96_27180 [Deltaproteobacteria bacterium]|nr:hypothetical protein [Deltaproteobacteria bacterium]
MEIVIGLILVLVLVASALWVFMPYFKDKAKADDRAERILENLPKLLPARVQREPDSLTQRRLDESQRNKVLILEYEDFEARLILSRSTELRVVNYGAKGQLDEHRLLDLLWEPLGVRLFEIYVAPEGYIGAEACAHEPLDDVWARGRGLIVAGSEKMRDLVQDEAVRRALEGLNEMTRRRFCIDMPGTSMRFRFPEWPGKVAWLQRYVELCRVVAQAYLAQCEPASDPSRD